MDARVREAIVAAHYGEELPDCSAGDDVRMIALTMHLYTPDIVDMETGQPVICATTLAALEGRQAQQSAKNYVAQPYLEEYRKRVDPTFEWSGYDMKRRCRTADQFARDDELARLARAPSMGNVSDLVYAQDGAPITSESRAQDLATLRDEAEENALGLVDIRIGRLRDYLNGLPSNRYSAAVRQHHEGALALVDAMFAAGELSEGGHAAALASMAALVAQPTPVYALSKRGRTPRLFPVTQGLLTLKSEIAAVYRKDWTTYDLIAAQAAINAVDWGADDAAAFLEQHAGIPGAIWAHLAGLVGSEVSAAKKYLKTALYSAQYGKDIHRIAKELDSALGSGAGEAFASAPFVADLVEARDRYFAQIERDGGVDGAFGDWIQLSPGRDAASLAAERSQGVELTLLYPAVELALATERWSICLWQHDGFDVAVRDRSRWPGIDRQIRAAVDDECRRRGYPTRLVSEDLPGGGGVDRSAERPTAPRPPRFARGTRV